MQEFQKLNGRAHAAFFVAVNTREQTDPEITASFPGTSEEIPRKTLREAKRIAICQMRREQDSPTREPTRRADAKALGAIDAVLRMDGEVWTRGTTFYFAW